MITEIQSTSQFNSIVDNSEIAIIDFYATWCGPCAMMSKLLQQLDIQFQNRINILKVNVQFQTELAAKYNIKSLPTLYVIKQGRITGYMLGNAGSVDSIIKGLELI